MDENPVLVEKREGYRVITLNRPQRLNAFNEPMQKALVAAVAEAETGRKLPRAAADRHRAARSRPART